jgi:hypothetical protein
VGILQTLVEHRVEFIVVGGVCAVLHGAPVSTFDLDQETAHEKDQAVLAILRRTLEQSSKV